MRALWREMAGACKAEKSPGIAIEKIEPPNDGIDWPAPASTRSTALRVLILQEPCYNTHGIHISGK
jgi:hypothetical protein